MTSNISFNKRNFMNKLSSLNGENFTIWKEKMKMFLNVVDFDLCDYVQNSQLILTHYINNEVVHRQKKIHER